MGLLTFGKIEYLNLLPFRVFIQQKISNIQFHKVSERFQDVPSKINKAFIRKDINSAFISSIRSKNMNCGNLGIIAKGEVLSVLLIEGEEQTDSSSETSNALAKILNKKGKVLIGDPALKYKLNGGQAIDLAQEWVEKYNLPFVFAKLCFHGNGQIIKNLENLFVKNQGWIPTYIINRESKKLNLRSVDIKNYLKKISFICNWKSKRGLKLFLDLTNNYKK